MNLYAFTVIKGQNKPFDSLAIKGWRRRGRKIIKDGNIQYETWFYYPDELQSFSIVQESLGARARSL